MLSKSMQETLDKMKSSIQHKESKKEKERELAIQRMAFFIQQLQYESMADPTWLAEALYDEGYRKN